MKNIEVVGNVVEIMAIGLGGKFPMGTVQFKNKNDEWEMLSDLLYEEFLDKKVKVTIEVVE